MNKIIYGAMDPEMKIITDICKAMNLTCIAAEVDDGNIVNPTNAYQATNIIEDDKVIFIECDVPNYKGEILRIDHHHEGDYGYDLDHTKFLEASSLGQIFKYLLNERFDEVVDEFELTIIKSNNQSNNYTFNGENWTLTVNNQTVIIPERIVCVSAIDHCPSDAYKGYCKGIDHNTLLSVRIEDLVRNTGLKFDIILDKFIELESHIGESCFIQGIADLTHLELGVGYTSDYLILREVALFHDIPIAVKTKNHEFCNGKMMFLSLSVKQVEHILNIRRFKDIPLNNIFGVPTRGYAGGMI